MGQDLYSWYEIYFCSFGIPVGEWIGLSKGPLNHNLTISWRSEFVQRVGAEILGLGFNAFTAKQHGQSF